MSAPEPRDIIAGEFGRMHQRVCYPTASDGEKQWAAKAILEALTAAGWTLVPPGSRVVPEGGVDALEKAITFLGWVSDSYMAHAKCTEIGEEIYAYEGSAEMAREHAAALRALAEAKP